MKYAVGTFSKHLEIGTMHGSHFSLQFSILFFGFAIANSIDFSLKYTAATMTYRYCTQYSGIHHYLPVYNILCTDLPEK